MARKIDYKKLEKKLSLQKKNCWEVWPEIIREKAFDFAEEYKRFLNAAKTEREAASEAKKMAEQNGFQDIEKIKSVKAGDKVYMEHKDKSIILARLGKEKLTKGFKMIMAHIDSPHLDLKVSPLYEEESLAFFKTHYYGGIKKYQWPTITLALHGVVCLENGKEIKIVIGEKPSDPIFMITDLLPHLERPAGPGAEVKEREVQGEHLNLLVGSIPVNDKKIKEKVKLAILEYLNKEYGMAEEDFASAELEAVPSKKARDLGFDRSLISAYGHDDRICAFAALKGIMSARAADKTQICALVDREEIGSDGATGAKSIFIESFISKLLNLSGQAKGLNEVYQVFSNSRAISADVTAALDPDYKDVYDIRNSHRLGHGIAIEKYTGAKGKYSTSEASAKFVQELRTIFKNNKNIVYQLGGGLGKVDQGGGGTIAKYIANRDIDIIDAGVALFNMHAPLEIASKADLYSAYLGYRAFLDN